MRLAVIGCGSIGRRHLANLAALGVEELVAFDPSAEARARMRAVAEPAARVVDEEAALWAAAPEGVVVASPPDSHLRWATAAASRGCHLFIEKPLAHELAGIAALREVVRRRGVVAMVACNMRFHPGPSTLHRLLGAGEIGAPVTARCWSGSYLPEWRPGTDYRAGHSAQPGVGGVALECIHEIDLALWLFGAADTATAATAPAWPIGLPVDGSAEFLLRHRSGVLSAVSLSFVRRDYARGIEVTGTEGTLVWDFGRDVVACYRAGQGWTEHPLPSGWTLNRMYLDEMAHWLDCVRDGRAPAGTLEEGEAALRVALAAAATAPRAGSGEPPGGGARGGLLLALGQCDIATGDVETNLRTVERLAGRAADAGADLLLLPELWSSGYDLPRAREHALAARRRVLPELDRIAAATGVALLGSLLLDDAGGVANTAVLTSPGRESAPVYRKVHLFGPMDEPRHLVAGDALGPARVGGVAAGVAVCYDLRFPELFRAYARLGVELVLVPAEWPAVRLAHWHALLRARAIECQCFVAGCNRVGRDAATAFGGGSAVVDPWGEVVAAAGAGEELLLAVVDPDRVRATRRQLPALEDARPELYRRWLASAVGEVAMTGAPIGQEVGA